MKHTYLKTYINDIISPTLGACFTAQIVADEQPPQKEHNTALARTAVEMTMMHQFHKKNGDEAYRKEGKKRGDVKGYENVCEIAVSKFLACHSHLRRTLAPLTRFRLSQCRLSLYTCH